MTRLSSREVKRNTPKDDVEIRCEHVRTALFETAATVAHPSAVKARADRHGSVDQLGRLPQEDNGHDEHGVRASTTCATPEGDG